MYCKDCGYWWENCICDELEMRKSHKIEIKMDKEHLFSLKDWDVYNSVKKFVLDYEKTRTY
jgi:hypothetical protein